MNNPDQFQEFMAEIKYATKLVSGGEYTLGEYYEHMAKYFDHIELPKDAEEHRVLAKKWEIEKGENNEN